jgi:ATP-dependent DNA helicase RecG
MAWFGDLDVSVLKNGPPGRQAVHSYLASEEQRDRWWEFLRKQLREGRQAYVISPLVSDNRDEATSAEAAFEHLANGQLSDFRLDLLHGRMSSDDKRSALRRFQSGDTQVLVATSVVEVGIDVPNANLMMIEHAERFGLAQLHQLRGRVSRGAFAGYVCLFAQPQHEEARQRLKAFVDSTDGFELAETDFQLRGPGDLFGTRQHGLPALKVADLRRDKDVLTQARQDARELLGRDPQLQDPAFAQLKRCLLSRYGAVLDLGDVG